jgi:hypothetical protein
MVHPEARPGALDRIQWLADTYDEAGDPVTAPRDLDVASAEAAVTRFVDAVAAGDLDDVDALAHWLGANLDAAALRRALAGAVVRSLAAAAHASILFSLLPRVARGRAPFGSLLRGPARELARHPDWQLRWFDDAALADSPTASVADTMLDVPMLGSPGSNFIYPVMQQAEESGIAAKLVSRLVDTDPATAGRDLGLIAALSMLQEPPDQAPYGWTHCLTMPQAVIALAGDGVPSSTAVAVAATYVVGFRAALGQRAIRVNDEPEPVSEATLADAIDAGRDVAAAFVWHAPSDALDGIVTDLASRAALHHDAHLVKYTLACFDAARADRARRRLHLAAAASLSSWWAHHPDHTFN